MRRILLWSGLLLLQTHVLGAQHIPGAFERWDDAAPALTPVADAGLLRAPVEGARRDYRYEGLLVGGLAFGVVGAWVGSQITEACPTEPGVKCGSDRLGNAVALGLVGAVVGGGLGYLVGRLSAKPRSPEASTEP